MGADNEQLHLVKRCEYYLTSQIIRMHYCEEIKLIFKREDGDGNEGLHPTAGIVWARPPPLQEYSSGPAISVAL